MSKKSTESNRPTHAIYQVLGESDKARWIRVGSAWVHKDLKGANLKFDSYPTHGRVVVREMTERDDGQQAATETQPEGGE